MSRMVEFGFGQNDDGFGGKVRRFKAKKDERYRVSFAWWAGSEDCNPIMTALGDDAPAPSPRLLGANRFYIPGVGYFQDKGPEYQKIAGSATPGKMYAGTLIVVWPIDERGNVKKAEFAEGKFQVLPWIFSKDKYDTIAQNHNQFPLGMHDLSLLCTDDNFQKMTFTPCRENLLAMLRQKQPEAAKRLLEQVRDLIPLLPNEIAQDLTLDEIRTRMAKANGAAPAKFDVPAGGSRPAVSAPAAADFDDLLSSVTVK